MSPQQYGAKVWFNGEMVHANPAFRPLTPGEDRVDVALREGTNELMLKVRHLENEARVTEARAEAQYELVERLEMKADELEDRIDELEELIEEATSGRSD